MTRKQRIHLMKDLWPAAAEAQGWRVDDREMRLRLCSIALGRRIESTNEITSNEDYDRVKAHLLLASDDLDGAHESDHPEVSGARRTKFVLGEMLKCLALYLTVRGEGMSRQQAATAYCRAVAMNKFGRHPEDCAPEELDQLLKTITGRTHALRSKAGQSVHEMRTRAGVRCFCAHCQAKRAAA